MQTIQYVAFTIGVIGAVVVGWGVLIAAVELVHLEFMRFKGENICRKREYLRHHLGSYILLGLEFLIAADIIRTVVEPTLQELAVLGSIVAIRTVLSFFLNREMQGSHECKGS